MTLKCNTKSTHGQLLNAPHEKPKTFINSQKTRLKTVAINKIPENKRAGDCNLNQILIRN
jgi:hypothetical protein